MITEWHGFLSAQSGVAEFEIVICNDGSKDATGDILDRLTLSFPQLRPLHFAQNQGAAAALNAAIAATKGDWVLLMDSDGQFPIENLPDMLAALRRSGGQRRHRHPPEERCRLSPNSAAGPAAWSAIWCMAAGCSDFNSAFKLVWGPTLRGLGLEAKGMNYSTEVTSRLLERGIVPVEVAIAHRPRTTGASSMKLVRGAIASLSFCALYRPAAIVAEAGHPGPAAAMSTGQRASYCSAAAAAAPPSSAPCCARAMSS